MTPDIWQMALDPWQVTLDTCHMTHDTCHVTLDTKQMKHDTWLGDNDEFSCYLFWQVTGDRWHMTSDSSHLTGHTWHVTLYTWHITLDIGQLIFGHLTSSDIRHITRVCGTCDVSLVSVKCHMSGIMFMCQASCLRCQFWPITCNLSHVRKGNSKNHKPTP